MPNTRNYALIPAAGSGSRMGSELPKQYLPLLGKPMLHHTLTVFCNHPQISQVFVVLSPDDSAWDQHDFSDASGKVAVLRCGGATRAETVLNGLEAIHAQVRADDWVLVHDAARPCLTHAMLDVLLAELSDDAIGGLLAVPVADTLKREGADGRVDHTEPRAGLWRAQTPQMFRYELLRRALRATGAQASTDEAQAVESLGHAPRLVMGDGHNLKVTYPEDRVIVELLLNKAERK
ncbi:MAG: 2-C-methyl-D-erythritol 4-phosphate cytidylyltransferase [Methylobacillus sp.]|nr:2-C-methyl-D-erythritol 4-phosphate cytidylyltransferase [Methylobacillus sp.]